MPILSCFVTTHPELCSRLWPLAGPFRFFFFFFFFFWKGTFCRRKCGWSVAACHITVSSCQICFDRVQRLGCFSERLSEWPLRRCSLSWNVLLLHWTLDQRGGRRSGAEVCRELQEGGQSTSPVQVLKGQFAKLPSSDLLGCRNMRRIKQKQRVRLMCYLSQQHRNSG